MNHRSKRTSTRTATTERRILESARRLLSSQSAHALTMRRVAAGAGVTIGAIYKHFRDRDALLARITSEAFGELELILLRAVAPLPVGSFDRVVALGASYISFAEEHREEFRILFSSGPTTRRAPVKMSELPGSRAYEILRQCVEEAIAAGEMRDVDPALATFFLWSRVHGLITLAMACDFSDALMPAGVPLTPYLAFELTRDFLVNGLLRAPRRRATSSRNTRRRIALGD
jgi:AcrR family transcriptional regulator